MSQLKQRKDGSYMSCVESLGANDLEEEAADQLYKKAAERILMGLELDDLLVDEDKKV